MPKVVKKNKTKKATTNPDVEQLAYVLGVCLDNLEERLDETHEQLEEIHNSKVQVENALASLHSLIKNLKD